MTFIGGRSSRIVPTPSSTSRRTNSPMFSSGGRWRCSLFGAARRPPSWAGIGLAKSPRAGVWTVVTREPKLHTGGSPDLRTPPRNDDPSECGEAASHGGGLSLRTRPISSGPMGSRSISGALELARRRVPPDVALYGSAAAVTLLTPLVSTVPVYRQWAWIALGPFL